MTTRTETSYYYRTTSRESNLGDFVIDPYDHIDALDNKTTEFFNKHAQKHPYQPPPPLEDHSWSFTFGSTTLTLESDSFLGKISELFQLIIDVFVQFIRNPKQFPYGDD